MKHLYIVFSLLFVAATGYSQVSEDYAVEITATTQVSPPQITLHWKKRTYDPPTYQVYKKNKTALTWGSPIATLTAVDSVYTDASVIADSAYEYMIWGAGATVNSYGYIYAGIRNPVIHNRGILVLLVDSTFTDSCAAGIRRLMYDMWEDGWQIIRHDVPRTAPDTTVKALLAHDYATHTNVVAALILGHVAVPYSADFNASINPPDGHVPQHDGAWPADIFYACITGGGWTDVTANDVTGSYTPNWNVPGDGKWDQDFIPTLAQIQIGRIDFFNMPAFSATEVQLMQSYLNRDHSYKMDSLGIIHRALINDNFGSFYGEAFGANGWRNYPPLVGDDSVMALPFISTLAANSYQWAYGCGGGTFTSAGGVGVTGDFAANPVNSIFVMLFGSFFGDWNVQDNFLRAPLCASTPALTSCWAGRPNWFFHHMALGEHIGFSTIITQNNNGSTYQPSGYGSQWIHVALMGDVTLRTDYIKPPAGLTITAPYHGGATLHWTASPDTAVIGYYVYRADSEFGYFQKISGLLTVLTYHDVSGVNGLKYYMVRPVKLKGTPSGYYFDPGIGIDDTATVSFPPLQVASVAPGLEVSVYPSPASQYLEVSVVSAIPEAASSYVIDETGRQYLLSDRSLTPGKNTFTLNVRGLAPGMYTLVLRTGEQVVTTKWVKL